MNTKMISILLICITLLYIVVGAVLFLDIQVLQAPQTTISIDIVDLTADTVSINAEIELYNPNSFDLLTEELEIVLLSDDDTEIGTSINPGGVIAGNAKKVFTTSVDLGFNGSSFDSVTAKVSAKIGMRFLGVFTKTIPFNIVVVTALHHVVDTIQAPVIHLDADVSELSAQGINISSDVEVYNPNSFDLILEGFTAEILSEKGDLVGSLEIADGNIPGKTTKTLTGEGTIAIEALNSETLFVTVSATAGAMIAGVTKTLDISTDITMDIPQIDEIFDQQQPTDLIIKQKMRFTLRGVALNITLEIVNPNNISLSMYDILTSLYSVKNDEEYYIGQLEYSASEILPQDMLSLTKEVVIPYSKLLFTGGFGSLESIKVRVEAHITIPGLDRGVWVSINGYQSVHYFR